MLQQLHVENYKCLRDVTVDLAPLTVLVGPNDSGKTSILEVVCFLSGLAQQQLGTLFRGNKSIENLLWRKDPSQRILWQISGQASGKPFVYRVELFSPLAISESLLFEGKQLLLTEKDKVKVGPANFHPGAQGGLLQFFVHASQEPFLSIARTLASTVEYRFDPEKLWGHSVAEPNPVLLPSGENLASVLDSLHNHPDRPMFVALEHSLHQAIPSLQGIRLPPVRVNQFQGAKAIEFILSGNGQPLVTIPAELASQGALLVTAYLALAYGNTPNVLLLEEPENGLHPARLQMVVELLRQMSEGAIGNKGRQIIITTHSPVLLNYARREEVRVLFRDPQQGTQVTSLSNVTDIDKLLKEFGVGELWHLLGEEKLVAGTTA